MTMRNMPYRSEDVWRTGDTQGKTCPHINSNASSLWDLARQNDSQSIAARFSGYQEETPLQDIDAIDDRGWTALHVAAMVNASAAADALLKCGAAVGHKSGHLTPTALHLAAWHGHLDVISVLLSHKADAAATNQLGEFPIDKAHQRGMDSAASMLGKHMECVGIPAPARVSNAVALTARAVASARAAESARPESLFKDPFAYVLAGREGRHYTDGTTWVLTPRTFLGDQVMSESPQSNVQQTVIVGAGMDARAFRLHLPQMHVFEVDQQTIFDVKEPIVQDAPITCARRHIVSVDLSRAPLSDALINAGFVASKPTCWLLEGLLMYLSAEAVDTLLAQMSSLSAAGSVVFHDGVSDEIIRNGVSYCGAKFVFGCDDWRGLWQRHGFRNVEALDFADIEVDRSQRCLKIRREENSRASHAGAKKSSTYFVTARN